MSYIHTCTHTIDIIINTHAHTHTYAHTHTSYTHCFPTGFAAADPRTVHEKLHFNSLLKKLPFTDLPCPPQEIACLCLPGPSGRRSLQLSSSDGKMKLLVTALEPIQRKGAKKMWVLELSIRNFSLYSQRPEPLWLRESSLAWCQNSRPPKVSKHPVPAYLPDSLCRPCTHNMPARWPW